MDAFDTDALDTAKGNNDDQQQAKKRSGLGG